MSRTGYAILFICFLVIVAHIWGAVNASQWNWGVHLFAFYGPLFPIVALAAAVSMFFPTPRRSVRRALERLTARISSLPLVAIIAIFAGTLVALALLFRAKLHLLGDGALLLRVISGLTLKEENPPAFEHQPLVEWIFREIKSISEGTSSLPAETIFLLADLAMGLLFLVAITLFLRTFKLPTADRVLLGCFAFFCGGSQFFLGYVELYVFLYTATACYLITGWLALERRLHLAVPVVCYGLMLGLHFGSIALFPSVLILLYGVWRLRRAEALAVAGLGLAGLVVVVLVRHVDFSALFQRIVYERTANMLPLFWTDQNFINPMISFRHVVDWLNDNLLMAPLSLLTIPVLLIALRRQFRWSDPLFLFLGAAALCGIGFTFAVSAGLGMARDWDFLASFYLPLVMLNVYLLRAYVTSDEGKTLATAMAVIFFIHWMGWIGVNASEERHLRRAELLGSPQFLGRVSQLNYLETMASFFYSHNDLRRARTYFDSYIAIESTYTRVLANVSELYSRLGDSEKSFYYLQRAAALHSRNPSVYLDLGTMYAARHDTDAAIAFTRQALTMDSLHAKAHANLAMLSFMRHDFVTSSEHYLKAIDLGLSEPFLYRDAASSLFFLGKYNEALKYYDAYLNLVPGDQRIRQVRNTVQELIPKPQQ